MRFHQRIEREREMKWDSSIVECVQCDIQWRKKEKALKSFFFFNKLVKEETDPNISTRKTETRPTVRIISFTRGEISTDIKEMRCEGKSQKVKDLWQSGGYITILDLTGRFKMVKHICPFFVKVFRFELSFVNLDFHFYIDHVLLLYMHVYEPLINMITTHGQ